MEFAPDPLEGASVIHSAEDRAAEGTDMLVLNDLPVLTLLSVTVNCFVVLL
jgi:hypothetical protein